MIIGDLHTFMAQRDLPPDLCSRINDYYMARFPNKKVSDETRWLGWEVRRRGILKPIMGT